MRRQTGPFTVCGVSIRTLGFDADTRGLDDTLGALGALGCGFPDVKAVSGARVRVCHELLVVARPSPGFATLATGVIVGFACFGLTAQMMSNKAIKTSAA